ncbi:hypothetical protein [Kitasatospora atroaurantiaca]|uniref:hypothetical protein n=1 Tax=Kitasatospora atroaurantiaca TaxID=285545 RepID=UPI001FE955C1|nr:hypothetical protein [Kitasatospora atroaurantiaca]
MATATVVPAAADPEAEADGLALADGEAEAYADVGAEVVGELVLLLELLLLEQPADAATSRATAASEVVAGRRALMRDS